VWSWEALITYLGLAWRTQIQEERALAPGSPHGRLAVLEAGEPPHGSTPLFDFPATPQMESVVIAAGAPFDEVLAAVAGADPTHLVGYASVVGHLARAQLAGELEIHPIRVSTNSEPLSEEDRAAIRDAWNAPIHNLWGSTEIGVHAVGCGNGEGLHICEDEVVLERVDESGQPVGPDEPAARTLATGLGNWSFPFIRYDLGDQVAVLPGRCSCGSAFARVAAIEGRKDDDFRYGARTIPASAFRHVLGTDSAIAEYQVRQTADGADVLVVGSPVLADVQSTLTKSLERYGLERPALKVTAVGRLERNQATGKLKRFIALQS
jgi:phenylacetate-coenzyme A ligase PaaK-like adenylate-forming protein